MAYGNGTVTMVGGAIGTVDPKYLNAASNGPQRNNVGDELDSNNKRLEMLHELLGQLEQRLSPVLRAVPPTGDTPGNPLSSASAMVDLLRRTGYRLDGSIAMIQGLIDRLEL